MLAERSALTYVAIDFETANEMADSACAVGLAVVEKGKVTRSFERLIRPPTERFSEYNFRVHGIEWAAVEKEPDFATVWSSLTPEIEGCSRFVAHNAGFDQKILKGCCERYRVEPPDADFICTMEAASSTWTLESYALPRVCQFLGIPLKHHNAKSDAEASAHILLRALADGFRPDDAASAETSRWGAKYLSSVTMALVKSTMADGKVEPQEIIAAAEWFDRNRDAAAVWPGSELNRRLSAILRDGSIEGAELADFRELCSELLGLRERTKARPATRRQTATSSVCFTGFGPRKEELRAEAEAAGYHVTATVTKTLDYLVCGPEPGPSKVAQAGQRGVRVVSAAEWRSTLAEAAKKQPRA